MIFVLTERATPAQVTEMLKPFGTYIKLAVDVERAMVIADQHSASARKSWHRIAVARVARQNRTNCAPSV